MYIHVYQTSEERALPMRVEQPPTQTPPAKCVAREFVAEFIVCHLSCVTCRVSFVEEFVAEFVPFVDPAEYARIS